MMKTDLSHITEVSTAPVDPYNFEVGSQKLYDTEVKDE